MRIPISDRAFGILIVFATLGLPCVATVYLLVTAPERQTRGDVRDQIDVILAGRRDYIFVSNEIRDAGMDEFLKARNDLAKAKPFQLLIEYSHDTDDFLEQIVGLRNVDRLLLGKNDVTDAGMSYVATLPDLKSLTLYEVRITDAGLKKLASSPTLERLEFAPREGTQVTIPALLALPHLRRLQVYEPYEDDWLKRNLKEFEQANSLDELTLIGEFAEEEVQALREKLPNCKVKAQSNGK